jgi:lactobin A/cerein 7B family class IIb bacteriocin
MTIAINMGAFIELDNNDLMSIDGGDTTAAIIVGVAAIGVVVLTALCPPAGAATAKVVGACLWKALIGAAATGGAYFL